MDFSDFNKVWEIKSLNKIGEDEARKILEKVAKQVQPIMAERRWKVELLSEFCPADPSLLGENIGSGAEVRLRLRRPDRDWDFFPYEEVLDTMLHELCHNEYGPHNAHFYNLWDEIRKECEELIVKGFSGDTYIPEGRSSCGPYERPSHQTLHVQPAVTKEAKWQCSTCTLLNEPLPLLLLCEACGTKKQKDVSKFKVWSCKFCTLENNIKLDRCLACGEWRYSHGPPVSIRGPYGT